MTSPLRLFQITVLAGLLTFGAVTSMIWAFGFLCEDMPQLYQGHSIFDPMSAVITSPNSNISLSAQPAAFGPMVPKRLEQDPDDPHKQPIGGGFTGKLAVVNSNACALDHPDFQDLTGKIALVSRGGCGFYYKVLLLQSWGALAVIVGDNVPRRGLITMFNGGEIDEVVIPSVFVSKESFEVMKTLKVVNIASVSASTGFLDTVAFLLVSPLFSLSLIYIILLTHRRYKMMKERLPKSYLDNLPVRIWERPQVFGPDDEGSLNVSTTCSAPVLPSGNAKTQNAGKIEMLTNAEQQNNIESSSHHAPPETDIDSVVKAKDSSKSASVRRNSRKAPEKLWVSAGECIICLDDYVPGVSKVMQLPCGHEFHAECITKWLVNRKKTCPICKMDVTQDDEHTPLITRIMRRGRGGRRTRRDRSAATADSEGDSDTEGIENRSESEPLLISNYYLESSVLPLVPPSEAESSV